MPGADMPPPAEEPHQDAVAVAPEASLAGLAKAWNDDEVIRKQLLGEKTLLSWPDPKMTGVINFATIAHNGRVLAHVLEKWCPQVDAPKTVNIDHVRAEARWSKSV